MRGDYNFVDTVGEDTEQTHLHVQQQLMITPQEDQVLALASILERETSNNNAYKIIVFFTTARLTGFMAELFNSVKNQTGYDVLEIHSRKSQKQRERASEEFRKRRNAIMFSSDVTARGMDYPDVSYVLQVGLTDRSQYIHRLGRTARAGKDGKGAEFTDPMTGETIDLSKARSSGQSKDLKHLTEVVEDEGGKGVLRVGDIRCPKCDKNEIYVILMQTRSSDEPETKVCTCRDSYPNPEPSSSFSSGNTHAPICFCLT